VSDRAGFLSIISIGESPAEAICSVTTSRFYIGNVCGDH